MPDGQCPRVAFACIFRPFLNGAWAPSKAGDQILKAGTRKDGDALLSDLIGTAERKDPKMKTASPITYIDAKDAPVLTFQGTAEPLVLPERREASLPAAAAPDTQAADVARYRRRVLLVLASVVLALGLYWALGYFVAYTDDAYVTSDLVNVAPYVSGRIISLNIVDNQTVKKSELLATIDPTPFQLS